MNLNHKSSRVGIQIRCTRCQGSGHNKKDMLCGSGNMQTPVFPIYLIYLDMQILFIFMFSFLQ
jgi:hypothetical protein